MKRLMSSCLAIAAIGLIAPRPAVAAALIINDAGAEPNIVFTVNDYEGGFVLDGTTIQSGLNNQQSVTVSEGTAASGPITHSFSGHWITGGLVPASSIIAFAENGIPPAQGVSDILTFTYTAGGLGGNLTGTFESDIDPGLLPLPAGATVVAEGTPFVFNNGNITASAVSDVDAVPEPATLALLSTALLGFGFLRRRREPM
jgi:hypothetical protein